MRTKHFLITTLALLSLAAGAVGEEVAGLPLHMEKLGAGAIRLWLGDHVSTTGVVALATEKGIVVVDTLGIPSADTELRRIIARELGREDFEVLVNTHEHLDHTGGNSVYADCTIVAHERCAAGIVEALGRRDRMIEWQSARATELEQEIETESDPVAVKALRERQTLDRLNLEFLTGGATPSLPTLTFSDRLTLDLGDVTLELYSITGMHSASDIAVLVPERGLLLTGDTMADVWLTDTPGCLAAFAARNGVPHDFPRQLRNWDLLLARKGEIRDLIPGHWNGDLTLEGFEARVNYVRALWDGINDAFRQGQTLAKVLAAYQLDVAFPHLASSPGFSARNNYSTITEMWKIASGQQSAAERLHAMIEEGASDESLREVLGQRGRDDARYYFSEGEVNAWGYNLLQHGEVAKAIRLFRLNVGLYPEAWNVYDSLGEALLAAEETDEAIRMYERSLEINPENTNGRDVLARIRSSGTSE